MVTRLAINVVVSVGRPPRPSFARDCRLFQNFLALLSLEVYSARLQAYN